MVSLPPILEALSTPNGLTAVPDLSLGNALVLDTGNVLVLGSGLVVADGDSLVLVEGDGLLLVAINGLVLVAVDGLTGDGLLLATGDGLLLVTGNGLVVATGDVVSSVDSTLDFSVEVGLSLVFTDTFCFSVTATELGFVSVFTFGLSDELLGFSFVLGTSVDFSDNFSADLSVFKVFSGFSVGFSDCFSNDLALSKPLVLSEFFVFSATVGFSEAITFIFSDDGFDFSVFVRVFDRSSFPLHKPSPVEISSFFDYKNKNRM